VKQDTVAADHTNKSSVQVTTSNTDVQRNIKGKYAENKIVQNTIDTDKILPEDALQC